MKLFRALICAAVALVFFVSAASAEPRQLLQGTQIKLKLLTDVSSSNSRNGDPFVAVVAEPVMLGDKMLIPAGTRINGIISGISQAKRFSIFRGEALLNLTFRSMEIDSRLIPIQMSLLELQKPSEEGDGRRRKDIRINEGQLLEQKHDIKGDVIGATIGTGGGTVVGTIFSHAARGFGIGLAGSAVYVVARKGKDIALPAQTGMLVRMDNTITVPGVVAEDRPVSGN